MDCKTCSGPLDDVTKKNCGDCRSRAREQKNAQRRKRRALNAERRSKSPRSKSGPRKCNRCSNVLADDYPKKSCETCLAQVRQRKVCGECGETAQRLRDGQCARCLGVCTRCLTEKPEADRWMCLACRTGAKERMARKRQTRKQSGLCPGCGTETENKVCDACRERARQNYQTSKRKMMWLKANQLVFLARAHAAELHVPCSIGTWMLCDLLAEGDYDLDPRSNTTRLEMLNSKLGYIEGNVRVVTTL